MNNVSEAHAYTLPSGDLSIHTLTWSAQACYWRYTHKRTRRGTTVLGPHTDRYFAAKEQRAVDGFAEPNRLVEIVDATRNEVYNWLRMEITNEMACVGAKRYWKPRAKA